MNVAVPLTPNSSSDNPDGQLEDGSDNSQVEDKVASMFLVYIVYSSAPTLHH